MKKKYIKIYYIAFVSIALFSIPSCKKNINLIPTDNITSANAITSTSTVELAIVGAYAGLSNVNTTTSINAVSTTPGAAYDNSIYANAIMSDEVRSGLDNNSRNYGAEQKWQFDASNPGASDVTAAWINFYNVIDRVNRVLAVIDNIPGDQATKDRQKGELLALRAFCHFELLRNYAQAYDANALGIPIVLQSSVFGLPARNTFAEVISQVKKDLTSAKSLIPTTFSITDPTRIAKLAVSAMQARVALYEKNWTDAITYATEAINGAPLATRSQFPSIWTDVSIAEVIFEIKKSSNTYYIGVLFRDTNNDVFFSPSYKEIDLFDKVNDIRYNSYIKQDLTIAATKEQWLVNKYPGSGSNKYNNTKVFRTGEMYLIRAEAYEQSGDLVSSAADLNTLRASRITGYVAQTFASKDIAESAILTERMKELFCEGHRFFDLKRKGLPVVRDDRDLVVNPTIPKTLNPTDRNYDLPIPQAEVFANPNIKNNPGY
ncbi:RagB/SusD family nutrient uptake outer membrane protein [Mucilaginibacter arboris]|uniref:RagB/SusD family nutrient uptake outer membrane protein n=1 Tax=Mucilaginibacter arboris TaxID=2682090 RepID=A0A7K1STM3_9SPHI|nr:RagB/SusD family nutrient uptake outer membrane protein [Mucilaginibacter arboris]MVN20645.1 RagB/SusD family nutrient uptake outer membrane protein [Mucilaginibacter arboris]